VVPAEQLASMVIAMAAGVAMERELDPKAVPDDMYARMLQLFFGGMAAELGAGSGAAPALAASEA
jgi:hypothetical protein